MDSTPEGSKHQVGNGKSESRAYTFQDWEWESIQAVAEHHGLFSGKVPLRAASSVFFDDILPAETGLVFSSLFFTSLRPSLSDCGVTRNWVVHQMPYSGRALGRVRAIMLFHSILFLFPPFFPPIIPLFLPRLFRFMKSSYCCI